MNTDSKFVGKNENVKHIYQHKDTNLKEALKLIRGVITLESTRDAKRAKEIREAWSKAK